MRHRIWLLLGLLSLSAWPVPAQEATIVFVNGVQVNRKNAEKDAFRLGHAFRLHRGLSREEFTTLFDDVVLAHNSTGCEDSGGNPCLVDFYDAFLQWSRDNVLVDADKIFWQFLSGKSRTPSLAWDAFLTIAQVVGWALPPEVVTEEEVAEHAAFYGETLKTRKVVLVAHSQGNYFANKSYASELLTDRNRQSLGVIAVASPASSVAGGGPHLTLWEDLIRFVPGAQDNNETNGFFVPSVEHHFFSASYLAGVNSGPHLMRLIDEVLALLPDPVTLPPGFNRIADMTSPRAFHCAVPLEDGRVLLAGGFGTSRTSLNTAEVFDPATQTFSQTSTMTTARGRGVTCVRLEDGRVLVAGGEGARFVYTSSAEVYEPSTGTFTPVGNMTTPRGEGWHAFAVPGGALLFAGTFEGIFGTGTVAVDRFDIGSNTFTRIGTLLGARRDYTAQVLADESVLLVGGVLNFALPVSPLVERYNTSTNQPQHTGQPSGQPRNRSWASALLPGGNVLVLAGTGLPAEVYNPGTGSFSILSGSPAFHSGDFGVAAELPDGRVLLLGYGRTVGDGGRIAEIFEPDTGTFTALGSLAVPSLCPGFVATPLLDGTILISGGGFPPSCDGAPLAEIFVPGSAGQ